jgi:hypothetical protein
VLGALGKAPIALSKGFAECRTRQKALGKAFAECHVSTRQKKSVVNCDGLFAECHVGGTRQRILFLNFFAEYRSLALDK